MSNNKLPWHVEIVHFPDTILERGHIEEYKKYSSFCPYFRMFLWKLLIVIPVIVTLIGVCAGVYVEGWLSFILTEGFSLNKTFAAAHKVWVIVNGIAVVLAVVFVGFATTDYFSNRKRLKQEADLKAGIVVTPKPPGLIKMWFMQVHEKMCPRMEY